MTYSSRFIIRIVFMPAQRRPLLGYYNDDWPMSYINMVYLLSPVGAIAILLPSKKYCGKVHTPLLYMQSS